MFYKVSLIVKWIIKISCRLKPICWKYTAAAIFHFFILDACQHTSRLKIKSSFLPPLFRSKGVFGDKVFARARQICRHITVWQEIKGIRAKNAENHIEVREEKMENTARVLSIISRFLHILRLNAHLTAYTIANALGKVYKYYLLYLTALYVSSPVYGVGWIQIASAICLLYHSHYSCCMRIGCHAINMNGEGKAVILQEQEKKNACSDR